MYRIIHSKIKYKVSSKNSGKTIGSIKETVLYQML